VFLDVEILVKDRNFNIVKRNISIGIVVEFNIKAYRSLSCC